VDPVTLGLVTQLELDALVKMAAEKKARDDARKAAARPEGPTLRAAAEVADAHADAAGGEDDENAES
jgi:hypothetical protein